MKTITLLLILSLAACGSEPEAVDYWRMPGGAQSGQFDRDLAACNNEARMIVGANRYAWFNQVRRDCLIGRGWQPA